MANGYKVRATSTPFRQRNISDLGISAGKQLDDIQIAALEDLQRGSDKRGRDLINALEGVGDNQVWNIEYLHKKEKEKQDQVKRARARNLKTDLKSLQDQAKWAGERSQFWQDFSPKMAKAVGDIATATLTKVAERKAYDSFNSQLEERHKINNEEVLINKLSETLSKDRKAAWNNPKPIDGELSYINKSIQIANQVDAELTADWVKNNALELIRKRADEGMVEFGFDLADPQQRLRALNTATYEVLTQYGIAGHKRLSAEVFNHVIKQDGANTVKRKIANQKIKAEAIHKQNIRFCTAKKTTESFQECLRSIYKTHTGVGDQKYDGAEALRKVIDDLITNGWSGKELDEIVLDTPVYDFSSGKFLKQTYRQKFPADSKVDIAEEIRTKLAERDKTVLTDGYQYNKKTDQAQLNKYQTLWSTGNLSREELAVAYKTALTDATGKLPETTNYLASLENQAGNADKYDAQQLENLIKFEFNNGNYTAVSYILSSALMKEEDRKRLLRTYTKGLDNINQSEVGSNLSKLLEADIKGNKKIYEFSTIPGSPVSMAIKGAEQDVRRRFYDRGQREGIWDIDAAYDLVKQDIVARRGLYELNDDQEFTPFQTASFGPKQEAQTKDVIGLLGSTDSNYWKENLVIGKNNLARIVRQSLTGQDVTLPNVVYFIADKQGISPTEVINEWLNHTWNSTNNKRAREGINIPEFGAKLKPGSADLGNWKYESFRNKLEERRSILPTGSKHEERYAIPMSAFADAVKTTGKVPKERSVEAKFNINSNIGIGVQPPVSINFEAFKQVVGSNFTAQDIITKGYTFGIGYVPGHGFIDFETKQLIDFEILKQGETLDGR